MAQPSHPPPGRYRLTKVTGPERTQARLGRKHVTFDDGRVQERERRQSGAVVDELVIVSVSRPTRKEWVFSAENGDEWRIVSCGCGS